MKNYTHHFDIDGIDVYASVHYDPGQDQTHDLPGYDPSHEITSIWVGDQQLDYSELFDFLEERIQEELGTPI
jgi:hypothetical protein